MLLFPLQACSWPGPVSHDLPGDGVPRCSGAEPPPWLASPQEEAAESPQLDER